ncbi:MAG: glycosyltransferase [Candidatus Nomurabacteria bacterium]|jgi:dolichol-phosphate mannosyltransferase|nr:glycosyltransferase [Candidatus Nomurabacteria bacterium]
MSERQMSAAIVIPAHDEIANLPHLLDSIRQNTQSSLARFTVFVVDDASNDDTKEVMRGLMRRPKRTADQLTVKLLNKPQSTGIGGAYIFAFQKILNHGFDYVLQMDADLQHDPKYIKDFVRAAGRGVDAVVSSRYTKHHARSQWKFFRKNLSRWGNLFIRMFLGSHFTDWTSGYNLYKVSVLRRVDFADMSHDFCFQLELKNAVLNLTDKVAEIPIVFHERRYGVSKMKNSVAVKTCMLVLKLWAGNHKRLRPGKKSPERNPSS